jgi:hypothetical protein
MVIMVIESHGVYPTNDEVDDVDDVDDGNDDNDDTAEEIIIIRLKIMRSQNQLSRLTTGKRAPLPSTLPEQTPSALVAA